jgi:intein/homing endonuclease
LLLFLPVLFLVQACNDSKLTPEDEIRAYIERGVVASENRDSGDLADMVHPQYSDEKGFNKDGLKKIISLYFFRHKNIHLFTRVDEIKFYSDQEALVTLHVAMAGQAISSPSMLSSLRARIYRFELDLEKQDEWLLRSAKWQPASQRDLE